MRVLLAALFMTFLLGGCVGEDVFKGAACDSSGDYKKCNDGY
jgi:hypothetical protein